MRFYLKTPCEEFSLIYCDNGGERVSTGLKIPTKYWNKEKQRVKAGFPLYKKFNEKLSAFVPPSKNLILPFYYKWATTGTPTKIHPHRGDFYSYRIFAEFTKPATTFEQIDYNFYTEFVAFLQKRGLALNSQGTHIRNLKAVMNEAYKRGLHTNTAYKEFKKMAEESDTVYLTSEELNALRSLYLEGQRERVRDLFLLGCNTAMRFSDYSRIKVEWLGDDGKLRYIDTKTGGRNTIAIMQEAKDIIAKYNGAPYVNEQTFNRLIKEICREAGIDSPVQTRKTIGREVVCKEVPKYSLVSSHTARRTAATLMIKSGMPVSLVMNQLGKKSEESFWRYVRLNKEEYANLSDEFFKKMGKIL